MNSLLIKAGVPQIRCLATGGTTGSLSYEVMIGGCWSACNYQFAAWWVGYLLEHSRKVSACLKKSNRWTGFTKIGGALWSTSWDMTDPETALSICAKGMNTNARTPLSDSKISSRGCYER